MTNRLKIVYKGLPLDCAYEVDPATGDGWNEPRYEAELYVTEALTQGVDVLDWLSEHEYMQLTEEVLKQVEEDELP